MIKREHYLNEIRPFFDSDLIKIIAGVRGCGKSVLLDQIEAELQAKGKRTLRITLEKSAVGAGLPDAQTLVSRISESLGSDKLYVFLDEVQGMADWTTACLALREKNLSLFVTGSSLTLLSPEATGKLAGRYVAFRIRPFVWREFEAYAKELGRPWPLIHYLVFGGLPKMLELETRSERRAYLRELADRILAEVCERRKIRKSENFRRLADLVLHSNAKVFSAAALARELKACGISLSVVTIQNHLAYLEEACLISSIAQFSDEEGRELYYYRKLYAEDVAFDNLRRLEVPIDYARRLENLVYHELVFRGYSLDLYRKDGLDVDFLAEKDGKRFLIQAAWSVAGEDLYAKKFAPLCRTSLTSNKILITTDEADFSTATVKHVRLKDFLDGVEL